MPVYSKKHSKHAVLIALGDAIRSARSAKGIAQEELAHLCELDRSYVGGVERGESNVTVLNVTRIASALSLSASELLALAGL